MLAWSMSVYMTTSSISAAIPIKGVIFIDRLQERLGEIVHVVNLQCSDDCFFARYIEEQHPKRWRIYRRSRFTRKTANPRTNLQR